MGNLGTSSTYILIIDRLPPQVGGVTYSIGPQPLIPDERGAIFTLSNVNQKITLSAIGGPIKISILISSESSGPVQTISLIKNSDSGLWSGNLKFSKPGIYFLDAKSIDGAENTTQRRIGTIAVLNSGKVVSGNSLVSSGTVTLWYFDSQTQRFVVWDGKPYGQDNPQKITKNGEYGFFVPYGKYYLEAKSYGYKTLKTEIFNLSVGMPIAVKLAPEKSPQIHLGPIVLALPSFSASMQGVSIVYPELSLDTNSVNNGVNEDFPNVDIYLSDQKVESISFRGKPTIYTFLSTWSPYISQQLKFLNEFSLENSEINIIPVISQESLTSTIVFGKRGEYSLPIYSDPDGLLVKPLDLSFLPTSVFVDRKGVVRKVKVGVVTKEEILDNIIN